MWMEKKIREAGEKLVKDVDLTTPSDKVLLRRVRWARWVWACQHEEGGSVWGLSTTNRGARKDARRHINRISKMYADRQNEIDNIIFYSNVPEIISDVMMQDLEGESWGQAE